jgi:hypothetical protein
VNIVILNWQRPLWEDNQEVMKRPGRDESMWVVTCMCMEATLGISLYSCLHLKLAKTLYLSFYLLCFLFNKIGEQEDGSCSAQKWGCGGQVAQTMYTNVSKSKNNKIFNIYIYKIVYHFKSKPDFQYAVSICQVK